MSEHDLSFLRTMHRDDLLRFRAALVLDRAEGADPAFCDRRITAIDAELARREDDGGPALDVCAVCGKVIGYGLRALHLGRCEDHPETPS